MHQPSSARVGDQGIQQVQVQVIELNDMIKENVRRIIDRKDDLDQLEENCNRLQIKAGVFNTKAVQVKRKLRCQNRKFILKIIAISAIIFIVLFLIVFLIIYFFAIK